MAATRRRNRRARPSAGRRRWRWRGGNDGVVHESFQATGTKAPASKPIVRELKGAHAANKPGNRRPVRRSAVAGVTTITALPVVRATMNVNLKPFDFAQAAARAGLATNGQPLKSSRRGRGRRLPGCADPGAGLGEQRAQNRATGCSARCSSATRTSAWRRRWWAMQKAQIGFQATLTVRNRLVSAYSEIMNMSEVSGLLVQLLAQQAAPCRGRGLLEAAPARAQPAQPRKPRRNGLLRGPRRSAMRVRRPVSAWKTWCQPGRPSCRKSSAARRGRRRDVVHAHDALLSGRNCDRSIGIRSANLRVKMPAVVTRR